MEDWLLSFIAAASLVCLVLWTTHILLIMYGY